MAKSKKATLTDTKRDYVSEKEIEVNGEKAWLVKTENSIKVTQGKKVIYDGPVGGWHRFLRTGKLHTEK
jgi:hypothetical protein